jgi:hypothetical protein
MMKKILITALLFCIVTAIQGQVAINQNNAIPDSSAMLDVSSSSKGLLIPRMTYAQRIAIQNPANGLRVQQTDSVVGEYTFMQGRWLATMYKLETNKIIVRDTIRFTGNTKLWVAPFGISNAKITAKSGLGGISTKFLGGTYWNIPYIGAGAPTTGIYTANGGNATTLVANLSLTQGDSLYFQIGEYGGPAITLPPSGTVIGGTFPDGDTTTVFDSPNYTGTWQVFECQQFGCGLFGASCCYSGYSTYYYYAIDKAVTGRVGGSTIIYKNGLSSSNKIVSLIGGKGGDVQCGTTTSPLNYIGDSGIPSYTSSILTNVTTHTNYDAISNGYAVIEYEVPNNIMEYVSNGSQSSGTNTNAANNTIYPDNTIALGSSTGLRTDSTNLTWNNTTKKMVVGGNVTKSRLSVMANPGEWIASDLGTTIGDRVVLGNFNNMATVAAHNGTLNGWATLNINASSPVQMGILAGAGTRMVVADASGNLGTQAIPAGGTVTHVIANAPLSVSNNTTMPTLSIAQANNIQSGYLSNLDWSAFNSKLSPPTNIYSPILFYNAGALATDSNYYYDIANKRLGLGTTAPQSKMHINGVGGLRVSSTNNGAYSSADWIALNAGGQAGDRVVGGVLFGKATIGAHNDLLNAWADFAINPDGGNVGIGTSNPNTKLHVVGNTNLNGGLSIKRTVYTSSSMISVNDYLVVPDPWTTFITLTLPDAAAVGTGKEYIIKSEATLQTIVVGTSLGQTIDGQASMTLNTAYGSVRVYSNGTNWFKL